MPSSQRSGRSKPTATAPPERRRVDRDHRRRAFWLILPTAVLLVAVIGYPTVWAVWQSLLTDSISGNRHFAGFDNYAQALWGEQSAEFWQSVRTTVILTVIPGVIELVLGIGMALMMNSLRHARGAVRAFILVPWAVPTAVAAVLWQWMLTPHGIINTILGRTIIWTAGTWTSLSAIMLIDIWKTAPFIALLTLAGLQVIPEEIHEAARVDGVNRWQHLTKITLPLAKPAIVVAMLFRLLDLLRMYDVPAILTHGANNTDTLSLFTFQNAIAQTKYGYGSALSTLTFVFIFMAAIAFIKIFGARLMSASSAT